jgi:AraC family transcriptional regulator of adaptative response/methylated-DNA-[protein]-cysteine methyltransferase
MPRKNRVAAGCPPSQSYRAMTVATMPSTSSLTPQKAALQPAAGKAADDVVTRAILYLAEHWDAAPSLDDLAHRVGGVSPAHLQRLFKARVGISPKRFCQHLTLTRAKDLLARRINLLDASLRAGLSGPSRLHDLFVAAEGMTPGEYKTRGRSLVIRWGICPSPIGPALLALTHRGICWLGLSATPADVQRLQKSWSAATMVHDESAVQPVAQRVFYPTSARHATHAPLPVLLRGTNFQLQVWRALLRIPYGAIATYGDVARALEPEAPGAGRAVRAVAAACGSNPVSYLIPCHRVIQSTGALCGYGWGLNKKRALLALEH